MIEIRQAVYEDIPNIMRFMDEHWKPGNILAKNRDFFEWQFVDGGRVNMFIGIDDTSGKIYGIVGAVVYSKVSNPDISGCAWQVIKSDNPMLGLELAEYMNVQLHIRYNCGVGLSKKSVRINELLGCVPGTMDHYYRLSDRDDYKIAKIAKKEIPTVRGKSYKIEQINSVDEMRQIVPEKVLADSVLSKDYSYIEKRYFEHPIYNYDIWKIIDTDNKANSVFVAREELVKDNKVYKIVDYYGNADDFKYTTFELDKLMIERDYEFVDVYSYGFPTEVYERAGFCCCDEACRNIIPNYFHPFVQENITLRLIDPRVPGLRMFRGDGDQDRPC